MDVHTARDCAVTAPTHTPHTTRLALRSIQMHGFPGPASLGISRSGKSTTPNQHIPTASCILWPDTPCVSDVSMLSASAGCKAHVRQGFSALSPACVHTCSMLPAALPPPCKPQPPPHKHVNPPSQLSAHARPGKQPLSSHLQASAPPLSCLALLSLQLPVAGNHRLHR